MHVKGNIKTPCLSDSGLTMQPPIDMYEHVASKHNNHPFMEQDQLRHAMRWDFSFVYNLNELFLPFPFCQI